MLKGDALKRVNAIVLSGLFLVLLVISLAACSPKPADAEETQVEAVEAAEIEEEETEVEAEPETEPTAASEEAVEEESEEESVADIPSKISECLVCHSDKQMLIDTADKVEELESENEGAG